MQLCMCRCAGLAVLKDEPFPLGERLISQRRIRHVEVAGVMARSGDGHSHRPAYFEPLSRDRSAAGIIVRSEGCSLTACSRLRSAAGRVVLLSASSKPRFK
jgi:hypothetical protein